MKTDNTESAVKQVSDCFVEVIEKLTTGRNKITKKDYEKLGRAVADNLPISPKIQG
jgi:hypothetical protein